MKEYNKSLLDALALVSQSFLRGQPKDQIIETVMAISDAQLASAAIIALHYMDEDQFAQAAREAYGFALSEDARCDNGGQHHRDTRTTNIHRTGR